MLQCGARMRPSKTRSKANVQRSIHRNKIKHLKKLLDNEQQGPEWREEILKELEECSKSYRLRIDKNREDRRRFSDRLKNDPYYIFKYINKFKKCKTTIGPLADSRRNLFNDPKVMSNLLNDNFARNFILSKAEDLVALEKALRDDIGKEGCLNDIDVSETDVHDSIKKLKSKHSAGAMKYHRFF